ncbi:hypothetical protein BGZ63DRAFT_404927 [Mariannaea sp. PMI_226]|nr:hypothetical protein BGZ63DRAFT_404927 [Mariannaea sp. PMI_226]
MRSSWALLALVAHALASPRQMLEDLKPKGNPPSGCQSTYDGIFEVTIFKGSSKSKRDILETRGSCSGDGVLAMTLKDGVLRDAKNRIGYIASNYQFQFDNPPQINAKFTGGFSACSNQSLALGPSTVFYQCLSGDFYNLYDRNWAHQCEPVEIVMMPCEGAKSKHSERKVVGTSIVATTVVTVVSAGVTKEVPTTIAVPMCQIGDGQVQVRTTPCDNMKLPIITAAPVRQIADGQIQVPTSQPPILSIEIATPEVVLDSPTETATDVLVVDTASFFTLRTSQTPSMTTEKSFKTVSETNTEVASVTETHPVTEPTETGGSTSSSSRGMTIAPSAIITFVIGITWAIISA